MIDLELHFIGVGWLGLRHLEKVTREISQRDVFLYDPLRGRVQQGRRNYAVFVGLASHGIDGLDSRGREVADPLERSRHDRRVANLLQPLPEARVAPEVEGPILTDRAAQAAAKLVSS